MAPPSPEATLVVNSEPVMVAVVLFTLIGYILVYAIIFYAGTYYLTRVIRYGLLPKDEDKLIDDFETPKRPFSATSTPFDDNPAKGEG